MNGQSFYCLDCWACSDVIRLLARDVQQRCCNCGAVLDLEWHTELAVTLAGGDGAIRWVIELHFVPLGDRSLTATKRRDYGGLPWANPRKALGVNHLGPSSSIEDRR
jgi:hypothetical protein